MSTFIIVILLFIGSIAAIAAKPEKSGQYRRFNWGIRPIIIGVLMLAYWLFVGGDFVNTMVVQSVVD